MHNPDTMFEIFVKYVYIHLKQVLDKIEYYNYVPGHSLPVGDVYYFLLFGMGRGE